MTKWAKKEISRKVEDKDVQAALRDLGFKVKPYRTPGIEKSLGMYTGKPKFSVKGLPIRARRQAVKVAS
jgi:hypothetical protein